MQSNSRGHKVFLFAVLVVLFSIYGLLHVVAGLYLQRAFPAAPWQWILWTLALLSVLVYILARVTHNPLTTFLYRIGSLWMGAVYITALCAAALLLLASTVPFDLRIGAPLILAVIAYALYNAFATKIRTIELPLKGLAKKLDGTVIVQLTDLHIGEIYGPRYLRSAVEKANTLNPDIVVITGDVFDGGGKIYPGIVSELKHLKQPALYVRGNHEVYEGVEITNNLIAQTGVTVLDDETAVVKGVQFIALSYPKDLADEKQSTLLRLAKKLDKKKPIILLRHEPSNLGDAQQAGVALQLSGHTHNGQLWPLNYLVRLRYQFAIGLHKLGDMTVYICPGVGTWGPPMRLGSRSEITKIVLKSS